MSAPMDSKAIAKQKVDLALKYIEQAQLLLSKACGELCPITPLSSQWDLVGNHMDATKQLWRDVSYSIPWNRIDLDSDAKSDLEKKARGES